MKNTDLSSKGTQIKVTLKEGLSYSWALSEKRNKAVRIILAIGTIFAFASFCGLKVVSCEVEELIKSNPKKYFECYFFKSLKYRGIVICENLRLALIEKANAKERLSANLEKYSKYFKVLVSGVSDSIKTKFIEEMMNDSENHDSKSTRAHSNVFLKENENIDFHKLSDSVVLCELPSHLLKNNFSTESCKKFDGIVIIGSNDICEDVLTFIGVVKKSNKPYLLATNRTTKQKFNMPAPDKTEDDIIDKHRKKQSDELIDDGLMPSNGKPFFINAGTKLYDFKEIEQLIKNKSFDSLFLKTQ